MDFRGKIMLAKLLYTLEMFLDAQLICHQEAMMFLAESGGRSHWRLNPAP